MLGNLAIVVIFTLLLDCCFVQRVKISGSLALLLPGFICCEGLALAC